MLRALIDGLHQPPGLLELADRVLELAVQDPAAVLVADIGAEFTKSA